MKVVAPTSEEIRLALHNLDFDYAGFFKRLQSLPGFVLQSRDDLELCLLSWDRLLWRSVNTTIVNFKSSMDTSTRAFHIAFDPVLKRGIVYQIDAQTFISVPDI